MFFLKFTIHTIYTILTANTTVCILIYRRFFDYDSAVIILSIRQRNSYSNPSFIHPQFLRVPADAVLLYGSHLDLLKLDS